MFKKRKTRVQIAIVKDEQLLVLYHVMPQHNREFWGLPGGGVEKNETAEAAAIREAKEETCLDIALADFRYEYKTENSPFYEKVVTFIGYPVGGEAKVGHDPEEGMTAIVKLTDIKWHPLYDNAGLEGITQKDLEKIRSFFDEKRKQQGA